MDELAGNDTSLIDEDDDFLEKSLGSLFDDFPNNSPTDLNLTDFTLKTGFELDNRTLRECTWRGEPCTAEVSRKLRSMINRVNTKNDTFMNEFDKKYQIVIILEITISPQSGILSEYSEFYPYLIWIPISRYTVI